MKIRILLFLYFLFHALLALIDPRRGMHIILGEKRMDDELRRYNKARVGDKL
jgi:hypothetical protein